MFTSRISMAKIGRKKLRYIFTGKHVKVKVRLSVYNMSIVPCQEN